MSDLKRLDEALRADVEFDGQVSLEHYELIRAAARAYRHLLANGQRMEPDYEAAAKELWEFWVDDPENDRWDDAAPSRRAITKQQAHKAVDAAIGDKLLIDPPEEESRDV